MLQGDLGVHFRAWFCAKVCADCSVSQSAESEGDWEICFKIECPLAQSTGPMETCFPSQLDEIGCLKSL